jgi:hypothetical protein
MTELRTRRMTVLAQDLSMRSQGRPVTASIPVFWEKLAPGPTGHRVYVVDYDATTGTLYRPLRIGDGDGLAPASARAILNDPGFHAQNVYALVMATLGRFEYALGRRVAWGFSGHQLKVVPHAFEEANAFYSPDAEALLFGYYRGSEGRVFLCLSHDIVVHETTHALVDGLRRRFMAPSSPDQAAFHEGFADVVALLSVFSLGEVLRTLLDPESSNQSGPTGTIAKDAVTMTRLKESVLFGLAEELGREPGSGRLNALRRSVHIEPEPGILDRVEFLEAHRRGEILVAAMMRAFCDAWTRRLDTLGTIEGGFIDLGRVVEEGAAIADLLLTMAVRALDYTPPIHLEFGDFLSAMLSADAEIRTDDTRFDLRNRLLEWFGLYGITPASPTSDGVWERTDAQLENEGVRLGSLQTEPIEMFRLIWANRDLLELTPTAYTRVASVRPCVRISPEDGLPLRETVAECTQYLTLDATELGQLGLVKPAGMPDDTEVVLEGGSTLILDEYGRLKFEIHNLLPTRSDTNRLERAQKRLDYLWEQGFYEPGASFAARLATMHRLRAAQQEPIERGEVW